MFLLLYKKGSQHFKLTAQLWQYTDTSLDNTEQILKFILWNNIDDLTLTKPTSTGRLQGIHKCIQIVQ